MLDTFWVAGLFDQKCEKTITMLNAKSLKAVCLFFEPFCYGSHWPNKSFFLHS